MEYYISASCCIEVSFLYFKYTVNVWVYGKTTPIKHIYKRTNDTQNCDSRKKNTMAVLLKMKYNKNNDVPWRT
jgi:hypothetical protein